jgi:hypothetical protein
MNSECPEVQALRALMHDPSKVEAFRSSYVATVMSLGSEKNRDQEKLIEVRRLLLHQLRWLRSKAANVLA